MEVIEHAMSWVCRLDVVPKAAPRMTQKDKWNPSRAVSFYILCKDKIRLEFRETGKSFPDAGAIVTFCIPMPRSWPNEKKETMVWQPHQAVKSNDVDNHLKTLLDALKPHDDSSVFDIRVRKFWAPEDGGCIFIELPNTPPPVFLSYSDYLS